MAHIDSSGEDDKLEDPGHAPESPSPWIVAKILALSAAKYWEHQLDPDDRLEALNRSYWRAKGRRCRKIREIYDYRDIARELQPLISEFFDERTLIEWFQRKPDARNIGEFEEWQLEALHIVMRF